MESFNKNPTERDITAVYRHPEAKADIVLVHGLNGHPKKTWTSKKNQVYWPTDLLPKSLGDQHANVLVYGYDAQVTGHPSKDYVHDHADTLLAKLTFYRQSEGTERLPIIWVAHSLGGIVTKCALLASYNIGTHQKEYLRSIYVSTYGIIFLGTPHNGSNAANWGRTIQRMVKASTLGMFDSSSTLLKTLMKESEILRYVSNNFLEIHQNFQIHMVHEMLKTDARLFKIEVVENSSASPQLAGVTYYGIDATHSGMCKFESEQAPGYRIISTAIRQWIAASRDTVLPRWGFEEDDRRRRANLDVFERLRKYGPGNEVGSHARRHSSVKVRNIIPALETNLNSDHPEPGPPLLLTDQPRQDQRPLLPGPEDPPDSPARDRAEPRFVHPEMFRPNSFFIGREDELRALHEMLMDRRRRSEGTSAVLIHCLPGGGKTHLARQYVFKHKEDYPGGVYWVRAKSRHDIESWFWRFAEDEGLRDVLDHRDLEDLRDTKNVIRTVRKWLNARTGWLMVFDGVQFDMPDLPEFIPDARNTSLIFTSTEQAVVGDPRFDNPQGLHLGLLTAEEARDLLLLELEMGRKHPWTEDDRAVALELVQLMGRLPLMIHVAAQHLKATKEPLARYLKSYKARPKAGGLSAYKAVREQLQLRTQYPALNLISLLAFFDQHIPVEMLASGLEALDQSIPVKTRDLTFGKPSLNNTLKVLIAFALIDRSEGDDISPTSSRSSKRSFDKQADHLDVLRIHSVVQAFFIDSLREMRAVDYFLAPATAMWCLSYDKADARIQEESNVGLPDDYRRFCIHGQKLLQNVQKFENRYPATLAEARSQLEERLEKIEGRIDSLSQLHRKNIIEGFKGQQPTSVFDRMSTSSQSGSSSSAMLLSQDSQLSTDTSLEGDEYGGLVQSPTLDYSYFDAQEATPYPSIAVMPAVPEASDDDQDTVISTASQRTQTHLASGAESAGFVSVPQQDHNNHRQTNDFEDWHQVIPHHRVIGRQELRRYHDRAGAWRDRTVSDPRIGLNREVAVGSISSRREASTSPSGPRLTAKSEAETELLNKLNLAGLPAPHEPRGSLSPVIPARPLSAQGTEGFARPPVMKSSTQTETQPAELAGGFAQMLKTLTVGNLKRVLSSRKLKDGEPASPVDAGPHPHAEVSPSEEEPLAPPGPLFRGSRSANSSPANQSSPFPAPSFSTIPTEELLRQPGPPAVERWETVADYPTDTALGCSEPDQASQDPMSSSYPSLSSRPHPHPGHAHAAQQLWLSSEPPAGYSSQPMSRNASHQSNPSVNVTHSNGDAHAGSASHAPASSMLHQTLGGAGATSLPTAVPGPMPIPSQPHRQFPTTGSVPAVGGSGARLSPFTRARRPSYTETEPSPRLDSPFSDVDTSYQQWERHHGRAEQEISSSPRARPGRGTRISRGRASDGWKGGRRAQSLSPSPSGGSRSPPLGSSASGLRPRSGSGSGYGPRSVSPLPMPVPVSNSGIGMATRGGGSGRVQYQHQHQHQQHPLSAEWSTPGYETGQQQQRQQRQPAPAPAQGGSSPRLAGGEPMSRSASGGSTSGAGIMVGDSLVEFGSSGATGYGSSSVGGGAGRRASGEVPTAHDAAGLGISQA